MTFRARSKTRVRYHLDEWIAANLEETGLTDAPKASPLFRGGERRHSPLIERSLSPYAVGQMLKRRLETTGLLTILSPRSFRVLVVMDLLSQNVPLEDIQYVAGYAQSGTTPIYDRCRRHVSRNLFEQISV